MSFKRDTVVQTWLRSLDLATAVLYLNDKGYRPTSMSDVVATIFEAAVENLIVQKGVRIPASISEAVEILAPFKVRRAKGKRNLLSNLELEEQLRSKFDRS